MYICIHCFTQPRTVTCYMTDLSSGQGGRPMKKPQQSWPQAKSSYEAWRGSTPRRTDRPSAVKWLLTLTLTFHPEDCSSMDLWNYGILPQHYTASQPRRPRPETSPAWKPQNSQQNTEFKIYNFSTSVVAINTSLNQPQVYQHIKLKIDNSVVSPLLLCGTEKTGQWMQKQNQNYSSWNDIQGMNCEIRSDGP